MPRPSQEHSMSEILLNSIEEVSVVDVYDLATAIGSECEKIIDLYGAKSVESLIPKCINALELLEGLAVRNERETSLIQELNDRIAKLESEKAERAETKKKFEKVNFLVSSICWRLCACLRLSYDFLTITIVITLAAKLIEIISRLVYP